MAPIAGTPASKAARPHVPTWLLAAVLVLVTIALYWPATRCDFVNYDDPVYVTSNPHVRAGLTADSVKWAFSSPVIGNWHPLTLMSHMLDCQLYGLKPWGHHLSNVLLHSINAALVFIFLRLLSGAIWRSLLVAALFAVHPLHVESVAWVAERKDVLSSFFGLLSLIFYVRYTQNKQALDPRPSTLNYILAFLFLALGLMSKPMLVTWPFVMLLLDYWPLGRFTNSDLRFTNSRSFWSRVTPHASLFLEKLPFFVLAVAISIITFVAQQEIGLVATIEDVPLGARISNVLISYCRYLGNLFWPTGLAVYYPLPGNWPLTQVLAAGLFLGTISVLFFVMRRSYPFLLVGWLWYVGTLVPVIQLVQAASHAMADRYTYLPSLGIFIIAVWGAYELTRRWQYHAIALSVSGSAMIIACMVLTRQQLGYWQDSETLFRHALAVTQNNYIAHNNLGVALDQRGQVDQAISQYLEALRLKPNYPEAHNNLGMALVEQDQLDAAVSHYQEAIRLKPDYANAYNGLGFALERKGQLNAAIDQYQEAIRLRPDSAEAHKNLGSALDKKGQLDAAISQYQEAIRLKPDYTLARFNLGIAWDQKGDLDAAARQFQEVVRLTPSDAYARYDLGMALTRKGSSDEAISRFQEAVGLKPDFGEAYNKLGDALAARGRFAEAVTNYRQAIQLIPSRPETFVHLGMALDQSGRTQEAVDSYRAALQLNPNLPAALNNLAWILATNPDDQLRNGAEAVRLAERACELTHYAQPLFLGTLAAAYAEVGRFPEAVATAEKAEKLAASAGLGPVAAKNRELLEIYRTNKPYHEPVPAGR